MLAPAPHQADLDVRRTGHARDRIRPRVGGDHELEVVARARYVDRAASQEETSQHRLPVARGIGYGVHRGLGECVLQASRQPKLDEERHALSCLDRLVFRFHRAHRSAQPHHLSRHGVSQQREVRRLSGLTRSLDQPRARAEIDPEQLAELAAGSRRHEPGHLVLDVRRRRNRVPATKRWAPAPPPSLISPPPQGEGGPDRSRSRPGGGTNPPEEAAAKDNEQVPEMRMIEAVRAAIGEEMERDERVVVMGEDVGRKGGVFGATDGLYARFGEARVLDTPLAESAIVGVAIGAALNGLIPIAEIQFADFIHPAFDQIVSEAARTRYRSNGDWAVPIVIRTPFGGGVHGGLYHSQSIEAFYAHVPGLKVVVPSMPGDAHGLLKSAVRDPDPVLFLEHKRVYRLVSEEGPDRGPLVPIGPAVVRKEGTKLSCFAWGLMTHYCLEAAQLLADEGVSVEVVDLKTLAPLDRDAILESVRKTGKAMVVHEDNLTGGFGGEVAAIIAEHAFGDLDGPVVRVAAPDVPAMPFNTPQEEFFMPSPAKIAEAMRKLAAY